MLIERLPHLEKPTPRLLIFDVFLAGLSLSGLDYSSVDLATASHYGRFSTIDIAERNTSLLPSQVLARAAVDCLALLGNRCLVRYHLWVADVVGCSG